MKKLKKILLINWLYFSKQVIEVDDINFITGKNGSGKSTIIDALQIVLLGELNARNFNKAANESSQRTLDGYLRADIDNKNPRSRKGKDFSSYIACEFWDDQAGQTFVIGIVFDCHNDGSRQERFFTYDGLIPEHCYVIAGHAVEISALRQYLKSLPSAHGILYDSQKQYRTDVLAKWNVHNEQVCRMLKKAVSFKPIVNIQDFITENICDIPDKPDIEAMQQNIRDYKRHEQLAQRQEEKLSALKEIGQLYRDMQTAIDRLQQQRFLVVWAEKEHINTQIVKLEMEKEECLKSIAAAEKTSQEIEQSLAQKGNRKDELIADRAKSDIFQEQTRLREQKRQIELERSRLEHQLAETVREIRTEAQALCSLCDNVMEWPHFSELSELFAAATQMNIHYKPFRDCSAEVFSNEVTAFEIAQQATSHFAETLRAAAYQIETQVAQLKTEFDDNDATLAKLKKNIKDYPKGLLELKAALEQQLSMHCKNVVHVAVLADVLEIAEGEEHWRGAVEGYLNTQKFYLLVEPSMYAEALAIYDNIKKEYGKQAFGLVDIERLRQRETWQPWEDSLAKKIVTDNQLAQDYINFLLGRVVCCAHVNQLRKHKTSITAEGMVYQGYVARPLLRERMEDAFIGRHAVALRIERLAGIQEKLKAKIEQYSPIYKQLEIPKKREYMFNLRFMHTELEGRQRDYLRNLEIDNEFAVIEEQLSQLDLFWLGELDKKIRQLEAEIKALNEQKTHLAEKRGEWKKQLHTLEYESLPDLYQSLTEKEDTIGESFSVSFRENIGIPRYQQELVRLRKAFIVAKNFGDRLPQTQNEQANAQSKLMQARSHYVSSFQPCSFRIDVMTNDEFEEEQKLLEESELPRYREKIEKARESALEQFQNDFLAKLKSSIDQVQAQVKNLNRALKQAQFGTDRYEFYVGRSPDYADYYDMIMAPELMEGEGGLFALPFQQKFGPLIEDLFNRIASSDDSQLNARKQSELQQNIERYTDYRTYLKFDLETTDQNGSKQMLSQTLNTKSGGETQTPFYIAVLASFAQLYQVNHLSAIANNTVRLVVFDEAFNKMDSDRIIESIHLLRKMGLQAIICTPPDKLPDIMPEADRTLLVSKEKYQMHILPYSKELALEWNDM